MLGTAIWQNYLMGETTADIEELATKSPVPNLFLFCPIEGVPFIQDETRKDGEHRLKMEQQLRKDVSRLVQRLLNYLEIGKNARM